MMYLSTTGKNETIKSNELVEIINQFRELEGGKAELQHDDFMKKIKKEIETLKKLKINSLGNFSESTYINSRGKVYDCFELTRDGMLQMLNSESVLVRYKTIEYINVLEEKITNKQPIGIVESLHLELEASKKRIAELEQIVFAGERKAIAKIKKKGILTPNDIELEFVSDSDILEIVNVALETGFLREEYRGTAISLKSMHNEASKKNIKKTILNKKLLLMGLVVPDNKNYAGNQTRYNEQPTRCYIIKKEKI